MDGYIKQRTGVDSPATGEFPDFAFAGRLVSRAATRAQRLDHWLASPSKSADMYRISVIIRHTFLESIVQPIYPLLLALGGVILCIFGRCRSSRSAKTR